jgi:type II secretion system protein C
LLVIGLAFFLADSADAALERRWASPPVPLPAGKVAPIVQAGPGLPVPSGLVELLSTTEPPATPESAPGVAVPPAVPQESRIQVTLDGSMAVLNGAGVAMLTVAGESLVLTPGQPLADWTLTAVHATSVVLERKGQIQSLELNQPAQLVTPTAAPAPSVATQPAAVAGNALPAVAATPTAVAVAPSAPIEPLTSKKELVALLDGGMADFAKQGSLKPIIREGEIVGFQIKVKDPAFPLARLGLQTGDIVLTLNGLPAKGPEGVRALLGTLRNSSSLQFEIERNGEKAVHKVDLEE